jgi:hypothetical protein
MEGSMSDTIKALSAFAVFLAICTALPFVATAKTSVGTDTVEIGVDFVGNQTLPGEKTVSVEVAKAEGVATATLIINFDDADFPGEGELLINGKGPLALFGPHLGADAKSKVIHYLTPAGWWVDGTNDLTFRHLATHGYRADSVKLVFSDGAGLPVDFMGTAIPGDAALTLSVDKPAGAAKATLEMTVVDADFPDEGELFVNGGDPIPLFGTSLSPDGKTVSVSYDMPAMRWENGENTVRLTHLKTHGFRIERVSVAFDNVPPPPPEPEPTVALACGLPEGSGDTLFIAPDGSDANDGKTAATPFKTFWHAVSELKPGDTLVLKDGTYTMEENSGDPNRDKPERSMLANFSPVKGQKGKPITIRAMHPGKAILDGQKTSRNSPGAQVGIGLYGSQFVNIAGLKVTRTGAAGVSIRQAASDIILTGMEITDNAHWKDCTAGADGVGGMGILYDHPVRRVTLANSVIHSNGKLDPDQHCGSVADDMNGFDQGLYMQGGELRVENNVFYNHKGGFHIKIMGYDGDVIDGHTVIITNNLFYGVSGKGVGAEAKIRRGAIIPFENHPTEHKTTFPLIQNNIFFQTESPLGAAIVSHRKQNWPQNDAFNNITTSKKLVDSSNGSPEEKKAIIGNWTMKDNKLETDPMIDLKESFFETEPLHDLAKVRINQNSPIIDAGRSEDAPAFDFFCKPRGAKMDVGPFKFKG